MRYLAAFLLLISISQADILLNQDFAAGSPPTGWTNTILQGAQGWSFATTPSFGSGGRYAVFDDNALGAATTPNEGALGTPSMNLTGRTAVYLRYSHHWFGVENTLGRVELSTNGGGSWTTVVDYTNVTDGSLAAPSTVTHDITALAAGQADVRIRFRYSDGGQAGRYWYLDNVQVYATPDVGITALVAPAYLTCATSYTATQAVTVRIYNYGPDVLNVVALPITVNVTGAITTTLNDTYTGAIPALGSVDFTLSSTLNMTAGGSYIFAVSTGLVTDAYTANNSLNATRTNRINSFPYLMDFNGTDGGWVSTPAGSSQWQWGPIPPTYASDGPEGQGDSWYLVAGSSNNPYVESPLFDFTGLANPVLSFDFKLHIQSSASDWNRIYVQYSTNNGASWNLLGTNSEPDWYSLSPYDYSTSYGFGGNSATMLVGNWTRAQHNLCALAGQSCVKFRINTEWINTGLPPIQFAFDNFGITNNTPDVAVGSILSPAMGTGAGCGYNNNTPVTLRVWNLRCAAVNNVPVEVQITGALPQTLTGTVPTIAANSYTDFTLPTGADLTAIGSYTFRAWTELAGDVRAANDSTAAISLAVTVPTINTYPYSEDFNAGNGNWVAGGTSGTTPTVNWQWQWGAIPGAYGVDGPEGNGNSWYLNATNSAGTGDARYLTLTSPIFDLRYINDPELSFDFKMVMNSSGGGYNSVRVQYTLDNGGTWANLGTNASPNWYSVAPICCGYVGWGGPNATVTIGNWTHVTYRLCELGGNSCVRFRLVTDWLTTTYSPREFAIDNFFIGNPNPYDLRVINIQQPVMGACAGYTATEPVTVVVENTACIPLYNVPITVNLTGAATATLNGTIPTIPRLGRATYTLPGTVNMTATGNYTFTANITHADSDPTTNTLVHTRSSVRINTFPYLEDFEADNGDFAPGPVNANDMWRWGPIPATYTSDGPEGNGSSWYLYENAGSTNPWIETPYFNLAGLTNPVMKFDFKLHIQSSAGDWNRVYIQYSTNGGASWNLLGTNSEPDWYSIAPFDYSTSYGFSGNNATVLIGNWMRAIHNLCPVAGQTCVKFRINTEWMNISLQPLQFALDNFQIVDEAPDVAVSPILAPQNNAAAGCNYNASTTTTVRVWNLRCATVNNVPVRVDATGPVNSSVTGTIASIPGNSYVDYTFSSGLNLTALGNYTIKGYTQLAGDVRTVNDSSSLTLSVTVPTISTFPYSENFNASNGSWVAGGISGTTPTANWQWQWGAIPGAYGVDGPEGNGNSWYLNATNSAGTGDARYLTLTSPIFDLRYVNDPELSFDLKMVMNSAGGGYNSVRMQYTLDNGASWANLGTNATPNWYSVAPICCGYVGWGGPNATVTLGNWTHVTYRLCELGGNSCVRFRLVTDWLSSSYSPREFAIDNFAIGNPQPYDLKVINIVSPGAGNCSGFGAAEQVTIVVESDACVAMTNVPVTVQITGATTATLNGTIPSIPRRGRTTYTLPGTVNMTTTGTYTFTATITSADSDASTNTLVHTRSSTRINSYPFTEDFNTDNGDFAPGPAHANDMWRWGPIPATYTSDGPEGQGNSWYLYENAGSINPYFESPTFDLSSLTNPQISFDFKLHIQSSAGDWNRVYVQYSTNGGSTWNLLGTNTEPNWYSLSPYDYGTSYGFGGNNGTMLIGNWTRAQHNLCPILGQTCVKFRISTEWMNIGLQPLQFALDNFSITNAVADVGAGTILTPTTGGASLCTYRTVNPQVRVYNYSCSAIANVPVTLLVSGAATATLNGTVASVPAGGYTDYTFAGTIDLSTPGTYVLKSYTAMPGDPDNTNDTTTLTVPVIYPTITSFPYVEDFNSDNGGWVPTAAGSSQWLWGTIAPTYAVDGPEGQGSSWYISAGSSNNPYVVSPIFDLTGLTNPLMRFDIKLNINNGPNDWNRFFVEYRTNNGAWQLLGTNADPNWYSVAPWTYSTSWGWGSDNGITALGNWTHVEHTLCNLVGQSCVQFRINTEWINPSYLPIHFAFDNFTILSSPIDARIAAIAGCYGSAYNLDVTIRNELRCPGSANITTADLTYSINGSATTLNLTGLNIAPGTNYTYAVPGVTIPNQSAVVRAWVKNPNGSPDGLAYNDSATANLNNFPQCNDHCSNAVELGLGTTTASQTTAATVAGAEDPTYASCGGGITVENTVWYTFTTNPAGGEVTVDIHDIVSLPAANGIQVEISEVTGADACNPADRTAVFCNNPGNTLDMTWGPNVLAASTQYMIAVDGYAGNDADFSITLSGTGVFPIEGFVLTGELKGTDGHLTWRADREVNNELYELQYRTTAGWQPLMQVPGAGTTSQPTQYGHVHYTLPAGTHYYRVRQQDYDGSTRYSNVVALQVGAGSGSFVLQPPFISHSGIEVPLSLAEAGTVQLQLVTALGQVLYSQPLQLQAGSSTPIIPTEGLAKGVYLVQATYRGQTLSHKLLYLK